MELIIYTLLEVSLTFLIFRTKRTTLTCCGIGCQNLKVTFSKLTTDETRGVRL